MSPTRSMTIQGTGTSGSIIKWTGSSGSLFYMTPQSATVQLTLSQLGLTSTSSVGSAVHLVGNSTSTTDLVLTATNVEMSDFQHSAVVAYLSGKIWFSNCYIHDNSNASGNGGAVQVYAFDHAGDTRLQVDASTFISNSAQYGGAIYVEGALQTTANSFFEYNSATAGGGGAIYVNWPSVNCTWNDGVCSTGMGGSPKAEIFDSDIRNNTCDDAGGAVYTQWWNGAHPSPLPQFTSATYGNSFIGFNTCGGGADDIDFPTWTCYPTNSSTCGQ
jgi:predicted outer membrane repeat protein